MDATTFDLRSAWLDECAEEASEPYQAVGIITLRRRHLSHYDKLVLVYLERLIVVRGRLG